MKIAIALAWLVCSATSFVSINGAEHLHISISLIRSEHSRDSNSTSTTITVNDHDLVYEESARRRKKTVHKEYKLTDQEVGRLKKLIKERHMLVSGSVEYPTRPVPHTYYELTVEVELNRKKSLIKVSGPVNSDEMKSNILYQKTDALLEEINEIIRARDEASPE